jgi:hypothetical protein
MDGQGGMARSCYAMMCTALGLGDDVTSPPTSHRLGMGVYDG